MLFSLYCFVVIHLFQLILSTLCKIKLASFASEQTAQCLSYVAPLVGFCAISKTRVDKKFATILDFS